MEETLGKRIAFGRKKLGLTQDQLAEKLGVTAQAVSKWENDQSCPDIATLPRLADIFNITTDALLGVEPKHLVEVVRQEEPDDGGHTFEFRIDDEKKNHNFEFHYDAGRKGGIGLAVWLILAAGLLLLSGGHTSLWNALWPSGLFVFGLFGLYPKFSLLRLGCALFGGYNLLSWWMPVPMSREFWLAVFLLLMGLSLLINALNKSGKGHIRVHTPTVANDFTIDGETFHCGIAFGEETQSIRMPRLSSGAAEVSFGSLTVDLSGCEEIAPNCPIKLDCSFGELELWIPQGYRAEWTLSKSFGNLSVQGTPGPDAQTALHLDCDVSFGEIAIRYL